jgi:hypothetical protein
MTDGNSGHLPSNVQTFAGPRIERHESLLARVGVHATVVGALLALAGTRLPWVAVIGMTVPWQPMGGGLATLALGSGWQQSRRGSTARADHGPLRTAR